MNTAAGKEKHLRARKRRAVAETASPFETSRNSSAVWFWGIVCSAFFLRLIYLRQIESIPLFYHLAGDAWTYDEWGQRLAAGDWLGEGVFYQAPLYPYFLGVLNLLLGNNLWLIRIVQIGLASIACGLMFRAGEKWFSRPAGIAAGLILACYAPAIFYAGLIEKSVLDLLLLATLLLLVHPSASPEKWRWLALGAVLGLLGLSRENALILVPVIALWILLHFPALPSTARARYLGLFLAGLLLILLPVGLRNLFIGGEFTLTTAQFGPNFFIGNNPAADGTYGSVRTIIQETQLEGSDARRLAERATGRALSSGEVSSYWFRQALDYIRAHPGAWLRLLATKWLLVWNAREIEDSDDFYIYQDYSSMLAFLGWFNHFGLLAPLAALGVYLTRHRWRELWLLHLTMLALACSVAIFYVFGRYRFPLVPLLTLFAAAGLIEVGKYYKARGWAALGSATVVLVVTAGLVNWPWRGSSGPGADGYNNLSNAYYKEGRVDKAVELAQKAIALAPDYGIAHYNLGNLYAAQGKFDLARSHFEEALRLYPNYAEVHGNYGQLLAQGGDLEEGARYFARAVALNPGLSRAQLNLGLALARLGRYQEATRPLEEAVRLTPESPEASYYLGSVYAAQDRYADAANSFRTALRIRRDFVPAHESLARVLKLQGKIDEAERHYQEAIRLMKSKPSTSVTR